MGVFPNFSRPYPLKVSHPSSVIRPSSPIALNRRDPSPLSKSLSKKVSFNLSPPGLGYHPKTQTTLDPSANHPSTQSASSNRLPSSLYPNFIHSHTINPSSVTPKITNLSQQGFINPLTSPIVKITKQLSDSKRQSETDIEGRYVMSRLRDPKILYNVRLYLAFLHNKPDSVCIEGKTKTYLKVLISQEGLPTEFNALMKVFLQFYDGLGINAHDVNKELSSFASFISSRRISHLQRSRNDQKNYYRS